MINTDQKLNQTELSYFDLIKRIARSNENEYLGINKPVNNIMPVVSVIIPTYQQVDYIEECLNGVLMQNISFPLEIIIGEDDSTDGTREICKLYAQKYQEKIRLFLRSRKDVISIDGFNTGRFNTLACRYAARGKYLALCEGDDYWVDPGKLAKQVSFLDNNADYILCCHDVHLIYDRMPAIPKEKVLYPFKKKSFTIIDVIDQHFIPTLSLVFRNKIKEYPLWYINSISGDIALALLLLSQGKGYFFHEIMGVKRKNPGSVTSNPERGKIKLDNFIKMYKAFDEYTNYIYTKYLSVKISTLKVMRGFQLIKEKRIISGIILIVIGSVKHPGHIIKLISSRMMVR